MKFLIPLIMMTTISTSAYANEDHAGANGSVDANDYIGVSMNLPEETQKTIGLTTEKVALTQTSEKIPVAGRIAHDPDKVVEVMAPQQGILSEQMVNMGSIVSKDQVVAKVGVHEVRSPAAGVVIASFSKINDQVDTISPIYTIADLSRLSATFDVYEKDLSKVAMGQKVLVYATAFPEQSFEGEIVFISPRVDETTFSTRIRVEISNPQYLLKLGMFVRGEILVQDNEGHMKVSAQAIQDLGGVPVVFVQDEPNSFTPVQVQVGSAGREAAIIKGDLHEGDMVVAGGSYILKSKLLEGEISGGCDHD
jgi:multidrug efflux pump subunit AcrA (membrane-fusion protein)